MGMAPHLAPFILIHTWMYRTAMDLSSGYLFLPPEVIHSKVNFALDYFSKLNK
jgi:hypothetical protein